MGGFPGCGRATHPAVRLNSAKIPANRPHPPAPIPAILLHPSRAICPQIEIHLPLQGTTGMKSEDGGVGGSYLGRTPRSGRHDRLHSDSGHSCALVARDLQGVLSCLHNGAKFNFKKSRMEAEGGR